VEIGAFGLVPLLIGQRPFEQVRRHLDSPFGGDRDAAETRFPDNFQIVCLGYRAGHAAGIGFRYALDPFR